MDIITLSIIVIIALGLIIRSFIKGTFWNSSLISGLGGAVIGIVLVLLLSGYIIITANGTEAYLGLIVLFLGGPVAAIIGAIVFISIGAARKKAPIVAHNSKSSTPQSITPESPVDTIHPENSSSQSITTKYSTTETYFGYVLGSQAERLGAYLAEKIVIFILLQVIFGIAFYEVDITSVGDKYYIIPMLLLIGLTLLGAIFYPIWSGNLGHKLFGLKVISSVDGSDYNRALSGAGREFLKVVMSLIVIPVIWLMSDSNRQNLYDKLANTYVVKRHEAMGRRGIVLRSVLVVVMILMTIFQYRFYSALHPGLNKNIIGKWNSVSYNIEFSENGNVSNNVFPIGYGEFETYTYTVNYLRYPFTVTFIPMNSTGSDLQPTEAKYFKVKFITENEILLFNIDESFRLSRSTSVKHYTDAKPYRTERFPIPENKISNDDLKQFWLDNIEAIINLDINKISRQTSLPFVVVNDEVGLSHQRSLFFNPNVGSFDSEIIASTYTDSLNNIKEIFPDQMRAGLRDMDYTNISQVQVDNEEIILMIYFLGEKYPVEYREYDNNYKYRKFGLLFEKRNGKWVFCGQSKQWGYSRRLEQFNNENAEVLAAEQDEFVEAKLNQDIQKLIQERNLQAIIDLDKSKIISQTHFPLEGNWGQALGLNGTPNDWTKEDLTTNLSKLFIVQYRSDFSYDTILYSKKPPLTFENADIYFDDINASDDSGVRYTAQNKVNESNGSTRMTFRKIENEWKLVMLDIYW